ncbi:PAS domain S-box protein [Pseudogemmobacter sonorensis]|uniref:PAS domain S-box protein n=1 Tax=Pseudogemmobacter sonorensis TaxID=2989681 RepID=UPI0036C6927B
MPDLQPFPESLLLDWSESLLGLTGVLGARGARLLRHLSPPAVLAQAGEWPPESLGTGAESGTPESRTPGDGGAENGVPASGQPQEGQPQDGQPCGEQPQEGKPQDGAPEGCKPPAAPPGDAALILPIPMPFPAPGDDAPFGALELRPPAGRRFTESECRLARSLAAAIGDQIALHATRTRLAQSERRFRLLVENGLDDFFLHDDRGRFLDVNDQACRNLGYSRAELLTMSATDISTDLNQSAKEELYRATPPGASARVRAHHRRRDGSVFPVEVRISCQMIDGEKTFLGLVRDISDEENARRALERMNADLEHRVRERTRALDESAKLLQQIMDSASDAITLRDRDGRYLLVNRAAGALLPGAAEGTAPPPDAAAAKVLETGLPLSVEERVVTPRGERVLSTTHTPRLDDSGAVTGLVSLSRDITARQAAEAELRMERERMTLAAEVGGLGVMDFRPESGALVCSDEWRRIFDVEAEGLEIERLFDRIAPEDLPRVRAEFDAVLALGGRRQAQFRIRTRAGAPRWLSAAAMQEPLPGLTEPRVICVVFDMTAHHLAQARLRESHDSLQRAERLARIGSWVLDPVSGRFASSDMMREMNGTAPGHEIALDDLRRLMPGADFDRLDAALGACLRTGAAFAVDISHLSPAGGSFAAEVRGQPIRDALGRITHVSGTVQDVSEREAARAQMAAIADSLPNGAIYRLDHLSQGLGLKGNGATQGEIRLSYISAGIERLIGTRAEDLMADPSLLVAAIHPEDRARYLETSRLASRAQSVFECDFRITRPDGALRWLQIRAAPRATDAGRVWDGIVLDVTDAYEAAEALRRARDSAEAAERAKADFLATMSHEIRTPMNAVIGMTRLALGAATEPRVAAYLQKIDASARTLLAIVNDILDFSRIEAGGLVLEETDFALAEVFETLSNATALRAAEKGLDLAFDIAPDVAPVLRGDPLRLGQVLVNLVGNAVKFTETGGVRVTVAVDGDGLLRFEVRDSGIGIAPDRIAALFKPFSQADSQVARRFGGTGLGLSISKRLVELMGGRIEVESAPGRGATFRFTARLAASAAELPAGPTAGPTAPPAILRGRSVLVVDDNAINLQVAQEFLALAGMRVALAASGTEALEALRGAAFDAVLMDMQMPGMDGAETTRRIRAGEAGRAAARRPVIALTAQARPEERAAILAAGMDAHLAKPLDEGELFAILAGMLQEAPSAGAPAGGPTPNGPIPGRSVPGGSVPGGSVPGGPIPGGSVPEGPVPPGEPAPNGAALNAPVPEAPRPQAPDSRGSLPNGSLPHAPLPNGRLPNGSSPNQSAKDGLAQDRLAQDGVAQDGMVPGGPAPHETAAGAPAPGGATAAALDLDRALARLRGDRGRLARMLALFLRDFGEAPAQARAAIASDDRAALGALAHRLRGVAGYFGADRLTADAGALEEALHDPAKGDPERLVAPLLDSLTAALAAASEAAATAFPADPPST